MKRQLLIAAALAAAVAPAIAQQPTLPTVELTADINRIEAEVANTNDARMTGLMFRKAMAPQHGMLFVFDETARQCMWMRNTLLPLSVAFIDEQGRIINIEDMQPQTDDTHCATRPAKYALEMNLGWFKKRGIGAGTVLGGIGRAPAAR